MFTQTSFTETSVNRSCSPQFKKTIARSCSRKRVLLKPVSTVLVHPSSAVTFTKEETEKTDQEAKESVSDNHAQNAEALTSVREILKGFARETSMHGLKNAAHHNRAAPTRYINYGQHHQDGCSYSSS